MSGSIGWVRSRVWIWIFSATQSTSARSGSDAHFAGHRPKTFITALGPMTLERAWYHCDSCHSGFHPRDRALGMEETFLSPAALRMIGITAARTSFQGSSPLLRELSGLAVGPKTVERHAEALGREVAGIECRVIEPELCDAPTLYLGLDGTVVPARKTEVVRRQDKQPDGSTQPGARSRRPPESTCPRPCSGFDVCRGERTFVAPQPITRLRIPTTAP